MAKQRTQAPASRPHAGDMQRAAKGVSTPASKNSDGKQEKGTKGFSNTLKLSVVLALISFMLYANTLKNGYILDDVLVITQNSIVKKGVSAIPEILSTPYLKGYKSFDNEAYRPLSLVMFAIEYQLYEDNPKAGHFFSILVFAGCVIMLFLFFDKLLDEKKTGVAFVAALLFALHPIHTEVVANIKSRDELLCFFFAFASLNCFMDYVRKGKALFLFAGIGALFLSFLSKETVASFIAIIPLLFFIYKNEDKRRGIYITAGTVGVFIVYLFIRAAALKVITLSPDSASINFLDNQLVKSPSAMSRLATEVFVLGNYLKLMFVPYPLLCNYTYSTIPFVTFGNIRVLASLAAYIGLAAFAVYRLVKNNKDPLAFGILFFIVTLMLFSNIPFLIGAAMAERFTFFASAGFCLVIALLIAKWLSRPDDTGLTVLKKPLVWAVLVPVGFVFSSMTTDRNKDWSDYFTLYTADVAKAPENTWLTFGLGNELITTLYEKEQNPVGRKRLAEQAIVAFNKSLAVYPDFYKPHAGLGNAYYRIGQMDSAEAHDKRALELKPDYIIGINNLAAIYFATSNFPKALELCKRTIAINPGYLDGYNNTANCFFNMKQFDSAIHYLNGAILIDQKYGKSYELMAYIYKVKGQMDSVMKYEALGRKYNPGFRVQ